MKKIDFRIQELYAANAGVVSVHPDTSLKEAVTKMVINDFSQLPVMSNERKVSGFISWKSIGISGLFGVTDEMVKEHMDRNTPTLKATDNFLESVKYILDKEFAFIRDSTDKVTGIITLYDIASQFKTLSEPFMILQHIETSIRNFIESHLGEEDLDSFYRGSKTPEPRKGRRFESTSDLTFGDYLRIMGNTFYWDKFELNLEKKTLIEKLDQIRVIRNEVMHFRTNGLAAKDLKHLKDVSKFFRMLENLKAPRKKNG